ncbi:hypothetical protein ACVWZV_009230 [Bradyrhizobium sp. GM5.1]
MNLPSRDGITQLSIDVKARSFSSKVKLNWWSGHVAAEETVTTVEPTDARH